MSLPLKREMSQAQRGACISERTLSYTAVCSHTYEPQNRGRVSFGGIFTRESRLHILGLSQLNLPDSYSCGVPEKVIYVPPPLSLVNRKPKSPTQVHVAGHISAQCL